MRPPPNLESGPNAGIRANPVPEVSQFHNYYLGFARIPAFVPLSKFGGGRIYIVFKSKYSNFTEKSQKLLASIWWWREIRNSPKNPKNFKLPYADGGKFEFHRKIPKISSFHMLMAGNSNFTEKSQKFFASVYQSWYSVTSSEKKKTYSGIRGFAANPNKCKDALEA